MEDQRVSVAASCCAVAIPMRCPLMFTFRPFSFAGRLGIIGDNVATASFVREVLTNVDFRFHFVLARYGRVRHAHYRHPDGCL